MTFGVNLSFAVKRWPEPEVWAAFVREELGVSLVQFSFDLLEPWWPEDLSLPLARRVKAAVQAEGLELHSAFVGLAAYTYNALLHPDDEGRKAAARWFERAAHLAAAMGAGAVGGPVGGMSVSGSGDAERRYDSLVHDLGKLTNVAKQAGLTQWLIEPTPLKREMPWTVEGAKKLIADLQDVTALPVRYALDVGHALYKPLYGEGASLNPWLGLGQHVGLVHLQQTDGLSDSHWGLTRPGIVNVTDVAEQVRAAGLDVPLILEVFYPFEADDAAVRQDVMASVAHCRTALNGQGRG